MRFKLRRAADEDAQAIAEVYFASFRLLTFLPMLHTAESYRRFIANVILKECAVTVVEDDTCIVSFLALQGEEVRLLYTRSDRIGLGAGTQLIEAAKSSGVEALELWCFQANGRARRFYEARGFHTIRFTDGAENEERTPDVRYRWERASNFDDEATEATRALLDRFEDERAEVPSLWHLELANAFAGGERHKRITRARTNEFIALIGGLPIVIDEQTPTLALSTILELARSERLSTYDASYLELAMRRGLALATKDNDLAKTAQRVGVTLLPTAQAGSG